MISLMGEQTIQKASSASIAESYSGRERRREDRRKRRFSLVMHERRSGFDRRGPGPGASRLAVGYHRMLLALRDRPRLLLLLLALVNVLNVADFTFTLNALALGGREVNPILGPLFDTDPLLAAVFKMVAVLPVSWVVWRCRRFRSGLEAVLLMVVMYGGVVLYHLYGLLLYC